MRIPVVFGLLLAACALPCKAAAALPQTMVTNSPSLEPPRGQWLLTLSSPDLGRIKVVMNFEPRQDGHFEAHSRPGVLSQTLGGVRAFVAQHLTGGTFERGALVHILQGCIELHDQSLNLRGEFYAPIVGRRMMTATLVPGRIKGELKQPAHDTAWATFEAVPFSETHSVRDYATLARDIRRTTTKAIYNPALVEDSRWKSFFNRLDHQLPSAKDDGEACYVLTNHGTSSAAEPLVELLKTCGRATIVGERTSGRMLSSQPIALPTGLTLIVPTADYYTARGTRLEGTGVMPNVATSSKSAAEVALQLAARPY